MTALLLLMPRDDVKQRLVDRINKGQELLHESIQGEEDLKRLWDDRYRWHNYNIELLDRIFNGGGPAGDYSYQGPSIGGALNFDKQVQAFRREVENRINRLRAILEQLDLYREDPSVGAAALIASAPVPAPPKAKGTDVFIVHGHAQREYEVAHVIGEFGAKPVILKEEINKGSPTLIEKLERVAGGCGYAIVLVTPDDLGRSAKEADLKPRARQNVVLELGFFIAKLGRDRVTILHDPTVEIPSDFGGVTYYPLDENGGWRARLGEELRAAGVIN